MTLTVGSLFSGIGGLELGLEAAAMEVLWQVEINPYCRRILAKHWPDAQRYADVHDVGRHNLAPVDVICGGFPCQDISYAGKGTGLDGHRSGLWYEFARVIGEMEPKYAVVENVPALATRGLDQVLGTLADLGYDAEWRTISAAQVGAPHLRKRIFIVAYANSERRRPLLRGGHQEQGEQAAGSGAQMGDADRAGFVEQREPERLQPELGSAERRGRQVRDWSDATPVRGADGSVRLIPRQAAQEGTESPLWPVADGLPGRVARLSAIGNAVVPRVALEIGLRIQEIKAGR